MADDKPFISDDAIVSPSAATAATAPAWTSEDAPQDPSANRSWGETIDRGVGSLASGINRGAIAATLGAPMDASAWLGNQIGRGVNALTGEETITPTTRPQFGSERIGDWLAGTVGETKPETVPENLLYGAGAGVGQAALGYGAGAALKAAGYAPRIADALMGAPASPKTNLAIGAASGAGSVGGEELTGLATDDPTAKQIGGLAGGLATGLPVGLLPAGWQAARNLMRPFTEGGRRVVGGRELLKQAGGYEPDLPPESPLGLNQTLAQRTNNPGLLKYERALETNAPPNVQGQYEADRTFNNQKVRGAMEQLGDIGDPGEHSQYMAGALDTAHTKARQGITDAYADVPGAVVPTQPLKDNFTTYVSGLTKARRQFVPDNYEQLLMSLDEHEPMRELTDLRSSLLADERSARSNRDFNRASVLRDLDKALFQRIPEAGPAVATPDQAATLAYQRANDLNRDFETTFNAGPMKKVFEGRGFDASVPDSAVAEHLLGSGKGQTERVAQFVKVAGMNPDAMQNARDWFSSKLASKVSGARQDAAGDPEVLGNVMRKFVQDNRALIDSPVFSPRQRELVDQIVEAVTTGERTARAGARGGSDTAQLGAGGRYIDKVVGGWFAPLVEKASGALGAGAGSVLTSGSPIGTLVGYGAGESAAKAFTQNARVGEKLRDLMYEATRNPDVGIQLMREASEANDAFTGPALRQILSRSVAPSIVGDRRLTEGPPPDNRR